VKTVFHLSVWWCQYRRRGGERSIVLVLQKQPTLLLQARSLCLLVEDIKVASLPGSWF